jgi:hypothetical protein
MSAIFIVVQSLCGATHPTTSTSTATDTAATATVATATPTNGNGTDGTTMINPSASFF